MKSEGAYAVPVISTVPPTRDPCDGLAIDTAGAVRSIASATSLDGPLQRPVESTATTIQRYLPSAREPSTYRVPASGEAVMGTRSASPDARCAM